MEEHTFPLVGHITISLGFARIAETDYPPNILEYADKALYFSKDNGRNPLSSYEDLMSAGLLEKHDNTGGLELF